MAMLKKQETIDRVTVGEQIEKLVGARYQTTYWIGDRRVNARNVQGMIEAGQIKCIDREYSNGTLRVEKWAWNDGS